ncbi:uncharacterized protein LOC144869795 isoform X3 [Branchiostoma floridae x Branchiostoma japonicum]
MAGRTHLTLCLTPACVEDILGFIRHYDFEDEVTVVSNVPCHQDQPPSPAQAPDALDGEQLQDEHPPPPQDPAGLDEDQPPPPPDEQAVVFVPQADGVDECRYCYCKPCITTPEPMWLGEQPASEANGALRRAKYKLLWGTMSNMLPSPWLDDRYLRKKERRLAEDAARAPHRRRLAIVASEDVREIMPKCVLKLVRRKYPNPPGKPYVGHLWC